MDIRILHNVLFVLRITILLIYADISSSCEKFQVLMETITIFFGDFDDSSTESTAPVAYRHYFFGVILANFLVNPSIVLNRLYETFPIFCRVFSAIGHVDDCVLCLVYFGYDAAYSRIYSSRSCRDSDDVANPLRRQWHDLEIRGS